HPTPRPPWPAVRLLPLSRPWLLLGVFPRGRGDHPGGDRRFALGQLEAVPRQAVQAVLHPLPGGVDAEVADRFAGADQVDREGPALLLGRWPAVRMDDFLGDGA